MSFPRPFHSLRPHPWHGLEPGPDPPRVVYAYVEITPFDLVERGEADDKIVAVLENDPIWAGTAELADVPRPLLDRLVHYFATYKLIPAATPAVVVDRTYGREHAYRVIEASIADYEEEAGRGEEAEGERSSGVKPV